jgi:thioredoxin-like negative regulator of GroEL
VGKEEYVVVKFYTKWCRYCRIISPEYEKFNEIMKTKRKDVIVARLEGEVNEEIAYEYGISSFPKIVLFWPHSTDISSKFKDTRKAEHLLEWIEENAPDLSKFRGKDGKLDLKLIEELEEEAEFHDTEQKPKNIKNIENMNNINNQTNSTDNNNLNLENLKIDILFLKNKYEELHKIFTDIKSEMGVEGKKLAKNSPILNISKNSPIDYFDVVVSVLFLVIIIAAFFTIKKIYNKLL